jgi:hypothetical protein
MQHCYLCGVSIVGDGYRRTVQTGSKSWSSWGFSGRGRISSRVGSGRYSGLRTVCADCARSIDRANTASAMVTLLFVVGLIVLAAYACSSSHNGGSSVVTPPAQAEPAPVTMPLPSSPQPKGTITDCLNTARTAAERAVCSGRFPGAN